MPDVTQDAQTPSPAAAAAAPAPAPAAPAPATAVAAPAPTQEPDDGPAKALVIVGNHQFERAGKRFVVVTEQRTVEKDGTVTVKTDGYPAGADLYYRTDDSVTFPKDAKVVTLGVDVMQGHFAGFAQNENYVNVGPASPAFAAANLAAQNGAKKIEIIGLTDAEKERLQPYFDTLSKDPVNPSDAAVTLT
jgi:hypothetical protein